jgi:hypothetical protein
MKTEQEIRDRIAFLQKHLDGHIKIIKNPRDKAQKKIYETLAIQKRMTITHLKWVLDELE